MRCSVVDVITALLWGQAGSVRPRGMLGNDLLALCPLTLHLAFQSRHLVPLGRSPGVLGYHGRHQAQQPVEAEQ